MLTKRWCYSKDISTTLLKFVNEETGGPKCTVKEDFRDHHANKNIKAPVQSKKELRHYHEKKRPLVKVDRF